jgi:REP element-mobilizing transposase RayT
MPDHLHWLVTLTGRPQLGRLMQRFKSRSAIAINRRLGREGKVWQSAYHDHGLRRNEDLQAAARYLVGNPLRAGLVEQIGDYPHWDAVWVR